ncbi:Rrf2 family transcriptional regulator [Desulfovibrio sp.]|uniref:RrF2 family transcriptional regulator n=1 Tax=Desulfovibrio sp. TaxID=885 RepID=UPI00345C501B
MRISTMSCHALHLLLCLSEQAEDMPASASELAVCTGISEKFVQKIMRLLQGGGIVKSIRGIAGGHVLARNPEDVSLADIIAAVEGGITLPGVNSAAPRGRAALDAWANAARSLQHSLGSVTLGSVRQSCGASLRAVLSQATEHSTRPMPDAQAGGAHAKTYSLGRQRCRKPRQAVTDASSA